MSWLLFTKQIHTVKAKKLDSKSMTWSTVCRLRGIHFCAISLGTPKVEKENGDDFWRSDQEKFFRRTRLRPLPTKTIPLKRRPCRLPFQWHAAQPERRRPDDAALADDRLQVVGRPDRCVLAALLFSFQLLPVVSTALLSHQLVIGAKMNVNSDQPLEFIELLP